LLCALNSTSAIAPLRKAPTNRRPSSSGKVHERDRRRRHRLLQVAGG
jgi:hypothetical protein